MADEKQTPEPNRTPVPNTQPDILRPEHAQNRTNEQHDREILRAQMETRVKLQEAYKDALGTVNFGSNVPLSETEGKLVEKKASSKGTLKDAIDLFINKQWQEGLNMLFSAIFSSKYAVKGLGFYEKQAVKDLPLPLRSGILAQCELADQSKMSVQDKVKLSFVSFSTEKSLAEEGYVKEAPRQATRYVKITEENATLGSMLEKENEDLFDKITKAKEENGKTPMLMSGLTLDTHLPKDTFLYLDKDNVPLYVMKTEIDPRNCPAISTFKYDESKKLQGTSEFDKNLEILRRDLQPGDVFIVSHGKDKAFEKALQWTIRYKQGTDFHGTHAMYALDEKGTIKHITSKTGVQEGDMKSLLTQGQYIAVTVMRHRDPEMRKRIASYTQQRLSPDAKYNTQGLPQKFININKKTSNEKSCVCSDVISDLIPEIHSPGDIAAHKDFDAIKSATLKN